MKYLASSPLASFFPTHYVPAFRAYSNDAIIFLTRGPHYASSTVNAIREIHFPITSFFVTINIALINKEIHKW